MTRTLGIDFGTSNSAAGYLEDGAPRLIAFDGARTLPTALFLDYEARGILMGMAANAALLDGRDGRYMRALKRVLGTPLLHEKRQIMNERITLADLVSRFLARMKSRAEEETGLTFDRALSGRPVVFHGAGDPREAQAEDDLRACYLAAGFREVAFMAEPEAAAIAARAPGGTEDLGLVVDIGGGTSDFSVFRSHARGVSILANHGVRIGGTDFDRAISFDHVMPLLGKGSRLKKAMGEGTTPVPQAIYAELATWEHIPFLYTAQTRRQVDEMARLATEPEKLDRLATILRDELGHDVALAVEAGKIEVNRSASEGRIDMDAIEPGLFLDLRAERIAGSLDPFARALRDGMTEVLAMAGTAPEAIGRVIHVGGSSLMRLVPEQTKALFPAARHSFDDVFTAVADGLAIAAGRD